MLTFEFDGEKYIDVTRDGLYEEYLDLEEAEAALAELTEAIKLLRAVREAATKYVRVSFGFSRGSNNAGWTYTYRDPSGSLTVGDLVQVPTGEGETLQTARVVALGRGTYTGLCKAVAAKLEATPL